MPYRLRPNLQKMRAYSPGRPIGEVKRELGLTDVIKLASNENPLGPSPKAVEAVKLAARNMNIYPDASGHDLKAAIGEKFGMDPASVILGNGSDEILYLLGLMFLGGPDDTVVMGHPSFLRYGATPILPGSKGVRVPVDGHWRHDLTAMAGAATGANLVFLDNPNNPTGTIVKQPALDEFLDTVPDDVLVVLDEAYYEFACDEPGYPDSLQYVRDGRSVVVTRTFSKSYGLAGIRVGYAFAPPEIVDAYNRVREPFNVNALAQVAAIAALDDDEHLTKTLAMNREGLGRIEKRMSELGFSTVESFANFVCIDVQRPPEELTDALLRQGVIVRPGHVLGMPNHIRVTIGTPDEVARFLEAFETVTA